MIFIKNLMRHDESRAFYEDFAKKAAKELNVTGLIRQIPLEDIVSSDAFPEVDDNIINWIIAKMEDRMLDEKISGMTIPEICDTRTSAGYHYADDYRERYQMLISAYRLLKEVSIHRYQSAVKEVIEDYVGGTYLIDTY